MKKYAFFTMILAISLVFLVACGGNDTNDMQGNSEGSYQFPEDNLQHYPEAQDWGNYPIIINGVGITNNFHTIEGEVFPTHVPLAVADILGLDIIQAGSQISIQQYGERLTELNIVNYLIFGDDRIDVSISDTFMAADDYFTIYVPITLFRDIGFTAYSIGGHVYINNDAGDMH